jgi:hypothetical protein
MTPAGIRSRGPVGPTGRREPTAEPVAKPQTGLAKRQTTRRSHGNFLYNASRSAWPTRISDRSTVSGGPEPRQVKAVCPSNERGLTWKPRVDRAVGFVNCGGESYAIWRGSHGVSAGPLRSPEPSCYLTRPPAFSIVSAFIGRVLARCICPASHPRLHLCRFLLC